MAASSTSSHIFRSLSSESQKKEWKKRLSLRGTRHGGGGGGSSSTTGANSKDELKRLKLFSRSASLKQAASSTQQTAPLDISSTTMHHHHQLHQSQSQQASQASTPKKSNWEVIEHFNTNAKGGKAVVSSSLIAAGITRYNIDESVDSTNSSSNCQSPMKYSPRDEAQLLQQNSDSFDTRNLADSSGTNGGGIGGGGLSPTISFWFRLNRVILRLCSTHRFKNLQVEMLYQRYFLRMNQSNMTHVLALLLALILALSCTYIVSTALRIQRNNERNSAIKSQSLTKNFQDFNTTPTMTAGDVVGIGGEAKAIGAESSVTSFLPVDRKNQRHYHQQQKQRQQFPITTFKVTKEKDSESFERRRRSRDEAPHPPRDFNYKTKFHVRRKRVLELQKNRIVYENVKLDLLAPKINAHFAVQRKFPHRSKRERSPKIHAQQHPQQQKQNQNQKQPTTEVTIEAKISHAHHARLEHNDYGDDDVDDDGDYNNNIVSHHSGVEVQSSNRRRHRRRYHNWEIYKTKSKSKFSSTSTRTTRTSSITLNTEASLQNTFPQSRDNLHHYWQKHFRLHKLPNSQNDNTADEHDDDVVDDEDYENVDENIEGGKSSDHEAKNFDNIHFTIRDLYEGSGVGVSSGVGVQVGVDSEFSPSPEKLRNTAINFRGNQNHKRMSREKQQNKDKEKNLSDDKNKFNKHKNKFNAAASAVGDVDVDAVDEDDGDVDEEHHINNDDEHNVVNIDSDSNGKNNIVVVNSFKQTKTKNNNKENKL